MTVSWRRSASRAGEGVDTVDASTGCRFCAAFRIRRRSPIAKPSFSRSPSVKSASTSTSIPCAAKSSVYLPRPSGSSSGRDVITQNMPLFATPWQTNRYEGSLVNARFWRGSQLINATGIFRIGTTQACRGHLGEFGRVAPSTLSGRVAQRPGFVSATHCHRPGRSNRGLQRGSWESGALCRLIGSMGPKPRFGSGRVSMDVVHFGEGDANVSGRKTVPLAGVEKDFLALGK